ncbi:hypothetical protein GOBAR_AA02410 [Gossypium barbadense]|uniref:Uncharacterized protein n=1 Tax=Gossypium barbadense TaxID=3634 RepID=A0A2P5YRH5_GOSBA|nr:hypothetical protein GOBAR_AA02410 [Gossypium barbadense]
MQRLCTKLRFLALQSTQTLPSLSASRRLLHHSSRPIHFISTKWSLEPFLNNSVASPPLAVNSFSSSPLLLSLVQVRHVSSRERAKRRKPMTPRTSKLKKIKMKSYSSYKSRFRTMNDGNIRRWREGKNHNAHLKGFLDGGSVMVCLDFMLESKKSRRRLRQPAIVPAAYAKVMKKLNFLFKTGEAYWWVEEIKEHNESGELAKLLKGFPIIHPGIACQGLCHAPTLMDTQKVVEENYGIACQERRKMSINSRNAKGEEIERNALPPVGSLMHSASREVIGTEAKKALMEMIGHVMGRWFNRYIGSCTNVVP